VKSYLKFLLFSVVLLTFSACEKEAELVDEELYKTIMIELTILNQMDRDLLGDREKTELREEIFESYGVDEQKFSRSHEIYQSDIEAQMERVREIQDRLRAERDSVQAAERKYRDETKPDPDEIREQIRNRNRERL